MQPAGSPGTVDLEPVHVVVVVAIAAGIVVVAAILRWFLLTYGDELKVLWHEYGPLGVAKLLERRSMPATPWYCDRCRSHNARGHAQCYACGAPRTQAELKVERPEAPTTPSAGRSRRTRR